MGKTITTLTAVLVVTTLILGGCRQKKQEPPPEQTPPGGEEPAKEEAPAVPGVTDEEIVIGQWSPQTGPAALWGAVARGTAAYFEMINAEGGINGRKLRLEIRDDAYQPSRTVAAAKELVEQENVFALVGGVGTATGMAVKDYLAEKGVPWVGPASGTTKWADPPSKNLFSLYPTYELETQVLVKYIVEELKKDKIAFFYQNDDYGKEGLEGARAELKKHEKELVAEVSVEVTDTDLQSHVMKLKEAKPDVVILWLLPKHAAMTLGIAAKLGFKPQWVTGSTLSDAELMNEITKGLWEGVIFDVFYELPSSDDETVKKYREAYEKYGKAKNPNEKWGPFFMAGFIFAEPLVEAMKAAGKDLTREKVIENMEKLKDWDGGAGYHIGFSPTDRQGADYVRLAKCEGGKAVLITDWMTVE